MTNIAPPATTWVGGQEQEYSGSTPNDIADNSGVLLVDATGIFIVDNGQTQTNLPATTWSEDDTQ